jgi:hypothetical protein
MATKKSSKSKDTETRGKAKATKLTKAQRRFKLLFEQDPPVVVGGGGSVLTYVKASATEIPSPQPGYRAFKLPHNIKSVFVSDGAGGTWSIPVHPNKHYVMFQD